VGHLHQQGQRELPLRDSHFNRPPRTRQMYVYTLCGRQCHPYFSPIIRLFTYLLKPGGSGEGREVECKNAQVYCRPTTSTMSGASRVVFTSYFVRVS
jgi:hypothetical protein